MKIGLLLLFFGLCTLVANAATPVIVVKTGGVPSERDYTWSLWYPGEVH